MKGTRDEEKDSSCEEEKKGRVARSEMRGDAWNNHQRHCCHQFAIYRDWFLTAGPRRGPIILAGSDDFGEMGGRKSGRMGDRSGGGMRDAWNNHQRHCCHQFVSIYRDRFLTAGSRRGPIILAPCHHFSLWGEVNFIPAASHEPTFVVE